MIDLIKLLPPIKLVNDWDIQILAESMVKSASTAVEKITATSSSEIIRSNIINNGLAKLVLIDNNLISCTFTLDVLETLSWWHLSLGLIMIDPPSSIPSRVPDNLAKRIVDAFGIDFLEVQPTRHLNVRHFYKKKK